MNLMRKIFHDIFGRPADIDMVWQMREAYAPSDNQERLIEYLIKRDARTKHVS